MKRTILFTMAFAAALLLGFQAAAYAQKGAETVKIKITSGETVITATLNDTAPSKDLISKLPLTLTMNTHQSREYYANIRLDKSGTLKNGYKIGDIAYWTPGNSLVLFYGRGHTDSLIIMGTITSGLDKLPQMSSSFSATIERDGE